MANYMDNTELYNNVNLWLCIDLEGVKIKSDELTEKLYDHSDELDAEKRDIAGAQIMWIDGKSKAFIYCANKTVQAILLGAGPININGKLLTPTRLHKSTYEKPERISIHGIPLHISNAEVSQWVEEYVEITQPVKYHIINKGRITVNTGNRFTYGHVKPGYVFPRYNILKTTSPFDPEDLIDFQVTVYISSQPVNCSICRSLGHTSKDCPSRRSPVHRIVETIAQHSD